MKYAKAIYGAMIAFIAPGATVLLTELAGDGIQGKDWLKASLVCVVTAAAVGGGVAAIANKMPPSMLLSKIAAYVASKDDVVNGTPVLAGQLVAGDAVKAIPTGHPVDVTMAGPSPFSPSAA